MTNALFVYQNHFNNPLPGGNLANDMSNKKHIKDYLHYYIGCDVLFEGYENPMPITGTGVS